jgi:hypothetical protein
MIKRERVILKSHKEVKWMVIMAVFKTPLLPTDVFPPDTIGLCHQSDMVVANQQRISIKTSL